MLTNIIFIAKKDFSYSLKEKTLLIWMFIMPLVFFGFIGSTTGGFGGNSNKKANLAIWLPVARLNQSNALVMQIIHRLEKENFNTVIFDAESDKKELKYHFQDYTRKLWIPEKIQHKFEKGEQIEIQYLSTASGLSQSRDKFAIEKALYQTLGDILIFKKTHKQLTQLDFTEINKQTKKITASVSNAGEKLDIPNGFNQAVPGILVMFIMMIALTNGSLSIFLERKSGILKRLAASPLSSKEIIMGKWLGKWFITLLQMIYGMLIGWLVFKIHWGNHLVAIIAILMLWAAMSAALAVLLGSFAQSEGQVSLFSTVGSLLLAALGGCWWPIEITPQWMQKLANFLPTGWIMDAMHKLMYFGAHLSDVLLNVLALLILTFIAFFMAFKKFKFA